jgi:hypothetical protein
MDAEQEGGSLRRTAIAASQSGLAGTAALTGSIALCWVWLAVSALVIRGLTSWILFPVGVLGAAVFGWICYWALKRRANEEPALIIDEAGIYDNVSIVRAGRLKWSDMQRVWIAGPKWLPVLCLLPDNVSDYMSKQDEIRGTEMRLNYSFTGAPVVVPMRALGMSADDVWVHIEQVAGMPRVQRPTNSRFVTGA